MKLAVALTVAVVLIFAKNVADRHNVAELGSSFASVYEDRLLVESYIYKFSDHLYRKKILLADCETPRQFAALRDRTVAHNAAITAMIGDYEKTKLTADERIYFDDFKNRVAAIRTLERAFWSAGSQRAADLEARRADIDARIDLALNDLNLLSGIQVSEGKSMHEHSEKLVAGSMLLTQFELAVLVGLGLILMALVFAARPSLPKFPQHPSLN